MATYYNEFNPKAAERIRSLMARGLIPDGEVDTRSIVEVSPDDLRGFTQCDFFAGIGGWAYARRLARWPDDRPVWTASCPCQPFTLANNAHGGAEGQGDSRDLWPVFFDLARECGSATILGEQVSEAIQWAWWDRAAMDLESATYAAAAAVLRADAYGARHERRRLYWLAYASGKGRQGCGTDWRLPVSDGAEVAEYGDTVARAGRALDGDFGNLLPGDGLSLGMVRATLHGCGNAIHIGSAVAFIKAAAEAVSST